QNGAPVSTHDAEMIARAFGFSSAAEIERVIAKREETNRERGIVSKAAAQVNATADRELARLAAIRRTKQDTALDDVAFDKAHATLKRRQQLTGEPYTDAARVLHYLEHGADTPTADAARQSRPAADMTGEELAAERAYLEYKHQKHEQRRQNSRDARYKVLERKAGAA
ncbi:hypothetical protein, partial [Nocardia pseudovaccinii]|uniref:hypothetical protein n=1 Tax=Nocardia pseudovaccinii TaxID=189540 RepID=UPI000A9C0A9D